MLFSFFPSAPAAQFIDCGLSNEGEGLWLSEIIGREDGIRDQPPTETQSELKPAGFSRWAGLLACLLPPPISFPVSQWIQLALSGLQ